MSGTAGAGALSGAAGQGAAGSGALSGATGIGRYRVRALLGQALPAPGPCRGLRDGGCRLRRLLGSLRRSGGFGATGRFRHLGRLGGFAGFTGLMSGFGGTRGSAGTSTGPGFGAGTRLDLRFRLDLRLRRRAACQLDSARRHGDLGPCGATAGLLAGGETTFASTCTGRLRPAGSKPPSRPVDNNSRRLRRSNQQHARRYPQRLISRFMHRHAQAPSVMTSKATTVVARMIPRRRAIVQFLPLQSRCENAIQVASRFRQNSLYPQKLP